VAAESAGQLRGAPQVTQPCRGHHPQTPAPPAQERGLPPARRVAGTVRTAGPFGQLGCGYRFLTVCQPCCAGRQGRPGAACRRPDSPRATARPPLIVPAPGEARREGIVWREVTCEVTYVLRRRAAGRGSESPALSAGRPGRDRLRPGVPGPGTGRRRERRASRPAGTHAAPGRGVTAPVRRCRRGRAEGSSARAGEQRRYGAARRSHRSPGGAGGMVVTAPGARGRGGHRPREMASRVSSAVLLMLSLARIRRR
jgi:hypothetical protein